MNFSSRFILAAGVLAGASLPAADDAFAPSVALDKFVVTATRTAVSVAEAPANVYVVDAAQIDQRSSFRLGDALAGVPGLYFRGSPFGINTPGAGQGGVTMRGISDKRTLVLVDGQPINSAYSTGINWSSIPLDDIARIEAVPGAFSSLYGGNAMGGVINVITRTPNHREVVLRTGAGGGEVTQSGASLVYRDVLSTGFGLTFGLSYRDNESYVGDLIVKQATAGAGTGSIPVSGATPTLSPTGVASYVVGDKGKRPWNQVNVFAKLQYAVGPSGKLTAGYSYDRYRTGFTPYASQLHDGSGAAVFSGTVTFNDPSPLRFAVAETDFLVLTPSVEDARRFYANYDVILSGGAHLEFAAGRNMLGSFFVSPRTGVATYASGPGTISSSPSIRDDFSAQSTVRLGDRHELVAGAAFQGNTFHRQNADLAAWRDPDHWASVYYDATGRNHTWGYFLQDRITLTPALTAYLGARYDDWTTRGRATQSATTAQPTLVASDNSYPSRGATAFSPKASLVWRAASDLTLRASAGTAFRTPTLLDLYAPSFTTKTGPVGVRVTEADPNLRPETLRTAEIGGDYTLPTKGRVTLTGYVNELRDLLYQKAIISGTANDLNRNINAGAARILGLESTVRQPLGAGFEVGGSFSYTDSELTRNDATPASVGKRLGDVPLKQASVSVGWANARVSTDVVARYSSHVFPRSDDLNTSTLDGVMGAYDAYTVVDVKVGVQVTRQLRASLAVTNAFDREYFQFYRQPGRSWYLELVAKF
ncbi:MAG TPA: TonB-dependent receptor [Opitutaceae bacterium]|nr:TonB-dependent receptor [Opitutaceae bacterium]